MTAFDELRVLLVGQSACGKDPQPLFALRIGDAVDAGAVLEVGVVRRQHVVHARPGQTGVIASSHRPRETAVAEVPDAKHRLIVREHCRGRMRVILARLRRTTSDDDLPLRILGHVDVGQRLAMLLQQRLLFSGCGFPSALRGLVAFATSCLAWAKTPSGASSKAARAERSESASQADFQKKQAAERMGFIVGPVLRF